MHLPLDYLQHRLPEGCVHAVQKVKAQDDPDLVVLETDDILFKEPGFRCDEEFCIVKAPL